MFKFYFINNSVVDEIKFEHFDFVKEKKQFYIEDVAWTIWPALSSLVDVLNVYFG